LRYGREKRKKYQLYSIQLRVGLIRLSICWPDV